jgi:hypothetical protein
VRRVFMPNEEDNANEQRVARERSQAATGSLGIDTIELTTARLKMRSSLLKVSTANIDGQNPGAERAARSELRSNFREVKAKQQALRRKLRESSTLADSKAIEQARAALAGSKESLSDARPKLGIRDWFASWLW